METILITGGAGFIGSHLVNNYSPYNNVVVLDNLSMGKLENINPSSNVHFIEGNIEDETVLNAIFNNYKFDYIFHLGAIASVADSVAQPWETHIVNQDATLLLLKRAVIQKNTIKRFLFASSAAVYGNSDSLNQIETDCIDPLSPYAVDKYASEKYTLLYSDLYGLKTTAVRFFNVYGENQNPQSPYSGVLSILMDGVLKLTNNESFIFNKFGTGEQTRDFVYVKDVVQALVLLSTENQAIGEVYNIGTGEGVSLNEVIETCEKVSGLSIPFKEYASRQGEVKNSLANIEKIKAIGYVPMYPISSGLSNYWNVLK